MSSWIILKTEAFRVFAPRDIDEDKECIRGTICIKEAFIVDNRKKRKTRAFIKGYRTGVVEALLNCFEVALVYKACPLKSNFKTQCIFEIKKQ